MATNTPTKQAVYSRRWREKYPEKKRAYHRLTRYGITAEQYAALVAAQGGACAICRQAPTSRAGLCVDHCHRTGVIRGLLCVLCNSAIGKLGDSPSQLRAAAAYLDERVNGVLPKEAACL